jgi:2-polyprenyl-6-methoxyphenol hydroxylase-like FAD-dependent oxidoreductase
MFLAGLRTRGEGGEHKKVGCSGRGGRRRRDPLGGPGVVARAGGAPVRRLYLLARGLPAAGVGGPGLHRRVVRPRAAVRDHHSAGRPRLLVGDEERASRRAGRGRARVRHRCVPRVGRPGPRADRHHTPGPSAPQRYRGPPADLQVGVRAVLIGDAAHPTTPNLGQGGCMAIEDAVVLARRLRGDGDLAHNLASFVAERSPRTSAITRGSRRFGRLGQWGGSDCRVGSGIGCSGCCCRWPSSGACCATRRSTLGRSRPPGRPAPAEGMTDRPISMHKRQTSMRATVSRMSRTVSGGSVSFLSSWPTSP